MSLYMCMYIYIHHQIFHDIPAISISVCKVVPKQIGIPNIACSLQSLPMKYTELYTHVHITYILSDAYIISLNPITVG
jgi:hypothetical protein